MKLTVTIAEVGSVYTLDKDLVTDTLEALKKVLNTEDLQVTYNLKIANSYAPNKELQRSLPDTATDVTVSLDAKKLPGKADSIKQRIVSLLVKLIVFSDTRDDLFLTKDGHPMITTSIKINKGKPTLFLDFSPLPTPKP